MSAFPQIIFRDPSSPLTPAQRFLYAVSHGADNFDAYRRNVAPRREMPNGGWQEIRRGYWQFDEIHYEIFANTRAQCEARIAEFKNIYPAGKWNTRVNAIKEIDGEFVAWASRRGEESWSDARPETQKEIAA